MLVKINENLIDKHFPKRDVLFYKRHTMGASATLWLFMKVLIISLELLVTFVMVPLILILDGEKIRQLYIYAALTGAAVLLYTVVRFLVVIYMRSSYQNFLPIMAKQSNRTTAELEVFKQEALEWDSFLIFATKSKYILRYGSKPGILSRSWVLLPGRSVELFSYEEICAVYSGEQNGKKSIFILTSDSTTHDFPWKEEQIQKFTQMVQERNRYIFTKRWNVLEDGAKLDVKFDSSRAVAAWRARKES